MAITIQQAYDMSIDLIRAGEKPEAAIFHVTQREINYPHDASRMLAHWHMFRLPPYDKRKGGYPR